MDNNQYSVYVFFENDVSITECRFVSMEDAAKAFVGMITNVAAKTGITKRVIITDGGDFTNMEWIYGEGVTYPPELNGRASTWNPKW